MPHDSSRARLAVAAIALLISADGCHSADRATGGSGGNVGIEGTAGRGGSGGIGSGGASGTGGASGGSSGSGSGGFASAGSGGKNITSGLGGGSGGKSSSGGASGNGSGGSAGSGGSSNAGGTKAGGAGGGGQTSTDPNSAPTSITGLKIEANPNNVLSAFVSWTTDKAANSVVQFGEDTYLGEISDSTLVTSHKVLIIGMHASKAYQIKAISSNDGSSVSATGTFTAGSLPSQIPVGTVAINDTTKSQAGWTLMNVQMGDSNSYGLPTSNYPAMAVMYDSGGQPVWYSIDGSTNDYGGAISVDLTDKGVLIGPVIDSTGSATGESPREVDFAGNTLWQCSDANCGSTTGYLTHHAGKLSNGDYVVTRWVADSSSNMAPVFEEFTPDNKKVWSLDYGKLVAVPSGVSGDWCHGNSITIDVENNAVYANCRWMGLIKTTYTDPSTLVWHLPASYNGSSVTSSMKFSPATSQFSDVHDPEIHSDGTILFFDNGGYNSMGFFGGPTSITYHSRAVEYKIDESTKTATLVWEFPGTFTVDSWYKNSWYQPFWGDADRLANGNVLVTAGNRGISSESRVFEVTKADGKVVWEFHLGPDIGIYRSERITPPLVHTISH